MSTTKATQETLNTLHGAVAKALLTNLDDPKILSQAIMFLKNNSIVVDELPQETTTSLFSRIEALKVNPNSKGSAVEDLLEYHIS